MDEPRRHLLMTRGLLTMRMAIPDRPTYGWVKWILPLPDTDVQGLLWYVDGSLLDGTDVQISRCGFAVVVLTAEFDLLAYGFGAPPAWVTTAAAAEAWAYLTTLRLSPAPPGHVHRLSERTHHPGLGQSSGHGCQPATSQAVGHGFQHARRHALGGSTGGTHLDAGPHLGHGGRQGREERRHPTASRRLACQPPGGRACQGCCC